MTFTRSCPYPLRCRYGLYETHHWESLRKNASKAFYQEQEPDPEDLAADASRALRGNTTSAPLKQGFSYWKSKAQDKAARLSYYYYNWRFDASKFLSFPEQDSSEILKYEFRIFYVSKSGTLDSSHIQL